MLLQAYFEWTQAAGAAERAQAVATLARAYLAGAHGADRPEEIEAALTLALDDPAPLVRRALAVTLADRADAPRALVLSLARDQAEVSGLLLARSPLLTEADLIDLATHAEKLGLIAIALRPRVSPRVAGALVARAVADATHALLANAGAEIAPGHLIAIAAREAANPRLRAALLARADLPGEARHLIMRATASALTGFLQAGGFLDAARLARATGEAMERGTLAIAAAAGPELPEFIDHLRENAELTPSLLLRAALSADLDFVGTALAELCELTPSRVHAMLAGGSEAALGALVRKAGLPDFLQGALIAALAAGARVAQAERGKSPNLGVIRAAQSALVGVERDDSLRLLALLRRYEAEAARAAARALGASLRARAEVPLGQVMQVSAAPAFEMEALRLNTFAGSDTLEAAEEEPAPAPAPAGEAGAIEPAPTPEAPNLAALVAQWKAEHVERDGIARMAARNENARANDKAA